MLRNVCTIEMRIFPLLSFLNKPKASVVLTAYLEQCNEPPWTSYFVKMTDIKNDQWGMSHFNWTLETGTNYHILRAGCFPYIKYHCSKRAKANLEVEDLFFRYLKIMNLGMPLLLYGLAATIFIQHKEYVILSNNQKVPIYFLYEEDKGSKF